MGLLRRQSGDVAINGEAGLHVFDVCLDITVRLPVPSVAILNSRRAALARLDDVRAFLSDRLVAATTGGSALRKIIQPHDDVTASDHR